VTGKDEELPSELLPKEVEKTLRKLGTDGKAVRGTLEREFANYLDERAKARKKEGVVAGVRRSRSGRSGRSCSAAAGRSPSGCSTRTGPRCWEVGRVDRVRCDGTRELGPRTGYREVTPVSLTVSSTLEGVVR
jgi:hypothetical protein